MIEIVTCRSFSKKQKRKVIYITLTTSSPTKVAREGASRTANGHIRTEVSRIG
jgi:hypothetical protein